MATRTSRPTQSHRIVYNPYEKLDDKELMELIVRGRESAFNELHKRYRVRLMGFAIFYVSDENDAEEIVQEAFIRVMRNAHRYSGKFKASTWIYTITQRLCLNYLRNTKRRKTIPFSDLTPGQWRTFNKHKRSFEDDQNFLEFFDPKQDPELDMMRRDFEGKLADAISHLVEEHREAFELRMFRGKSYQEIARILKIEVGTVKSRLHRAREGIKAQLNPRHFDN